MKSHTKWIVLILILIAAAVLTIPVVANILPHPDEYQFYVNAWGIMKGEGLANFLHIALTEYALTAFLLLVNLLVPSGVAFPQKDGPTNVTFFFGHIFGLGIYILTFVMGYFLMQKGEKKLQWRTIFFAILYFGSLGMFERSLRVNSDITSVLVMLNYLFISLWLHRKRAPVLKFFICDALFVFLSSFTNLKALYLVFPISAINILGVFFWYDRKKDLTKDKLPVLYRLILYGSGVALTSVFLWYLLIPRPLDIKIFWYNIKNATVEGVTWDYEYPGQSHDSWLVYIYDLVMEYFGLSQFIAVLAILVLTAKTNLREWLGRLAKYLPRSGTFWQDIWGENLTKHTELILAFCFITYYLGVSATTVHWSRWGVPLGILALMISSSWLQEAYLTLRDNLKWPKWGVAGGVVLLFCLAWSLRVLLTIDLKKSGYPWLVTYPRTVADIDKFMSEQGLKKREDLKVWEKAAWFTGYTNNVASLSLEKLVEPEWRDTKYLLWPGWNLGVLYSKKPVDMSTSNQRAFVDKYASKIDFRFPAYVSRYNHWAEWFAWRVLGITWYPETNSLIEYHYGLLTLRDMPPSLSYTYEVDGSDLVTYSSPKKSLIFNIGQLPDSYVWPVCYSTPEVKYASTGQAVEPPAGHGGYGRTAGLYCNSLWFRVFLKGRYQITFEGLPKDLEKEELMVYSTQPFAWEPETSTMVIEKPTLISVEVGVAVANKRIPDLKVIVSYDSLD